MDSPATPQAEPAKPPSKEPIGFWGWVNRLGLITSIITSVVAIVISVLALNTSLNTWRFQELKATMMGQTRAHLTAIPYPDPKDPKGLTIVNAGTIGAHDVVVQCTHLVEGGKTFLLADWECANEVLPGQSFFVPCAMPPTGIIRVEISHDTAIQGWDLKDVIYLSNQAIYSTKMYGIYPSNSKQVEEFVKKKDQ